MRLQFLLVIVLFTSSVFCYSQTSEDQRIILQKILDIPEVEVEIGKLEIRTTEGRVVFLQNGNFPNVLLQKNGERILAMTLEQLFERVIPEKDLLKIILFEINNDKANLVIKNPRLSLTITLEKIQGDWIIKKISR